MSILTQLQVDVNASSDEPDWGDRIPFLGETSPEEYDANVMPEGSDPAAMDAECMPLVVWLGVYGEGLWALEPAWGFWEE